MTTPRDHTLAFLGAFYGVNTVYDFRAMHDRDKTAPAKTWRGRFVDVEQALREANAAGYGIHIVINQIGDAVKPDTGRISYRRTNVVACRAQLLDLDGFDAGQQLERLRASTTPPHIIVHTSPGKVQNWLKVRPHADIQLHEDNQRRLFGEFNGDEQFVDAAHTARLPGFYHNKREPHLVTVSAGPLWGQAEYDPWAICGALLHVSIESGSADRQPLGYAPWQAPSAEWLVYALNRIDPNGLGRMAWLATTAAMKQAGWFLGEPVVRSIWDQWCSRFQSDKPVTPYEYNKQWRSIDATSAGWSALVKRSGIQGDLMAAGMPAPSMSTTPTAASVQPTQAVPAAQPMALGNFLRPEEQAVYFRDCYWISSLGRILTPDLILMDQNKFNGTYGGRSFVLDDVGKAGKNPWEAALQGQLFRITKVTNMRFLPDRPFGDQTEDEFGRIGVNVYRPARYVGIPGDVTPFLDHLARVLPVQRDRDILLAFMAQCIQRPGVKVKWAVVIQGVEGLGKTLFEYIMAAALGPSYVHVPAAKELTEGGGKFNGWMRNKLMIIINEVKSDEKRELVEVMKPWITDKRIEMQNKGQDQDMADNPTNWLMFTNHKDAIPISVNGRRYAIMYSALQSSSDLARLDMTDEYFSKLYDWAESGGIAHVVDYLMKYAVPADLDGKIGCTRAPRTSSTDEALAESRGWLETMILEAVERQDQGFRGGWVSSCAVSKLVKDNGQRLPVSRTLGMIFKSIGYYRIGLAPRVFQQEGSPYKATLYSVMEGADVSTFGTLQGYEPAAGGSSVVPMWPVPHAAE